jgi:mono/diheme cytochrome c family protein
MRLVLLISLAATVAAAAQSADSGRTVWNGVYTEAQADRGQREYSAHCANNCHRDDLSGYNEVLRGQRFMEKYREASLHLLFDKIKTTMPRNAAGSLSDQQYVDIVTYVLRANEFPAGSDELSVDLLPQIQLVGKGGAEPVPNFSLVQVVGCLVRSDAEKAWMLTNSTEPARAGYPQPSDADRSAAVARPLGSQLFNLMVTPAYKPETHQDKKVEVRGFLIRNPKQNRINITSLETVADNCGNQ